ncbi:alpha/beta fold hydrolase [Buchnera aphidicola]|nr:alpha/beta fold hydrolase [Buchnera aphidicola]
MTIDNIIELLNNKMPKNAIWLGWSIGGLIASRFALHYPKNILAIISVASSPCFIAKKNWPGITKCTVYRFYKNLKTNYYETLHTFLTLQQRNLINSIELKKIIYSQNKPSIKLLIEGLKIICSVDLRLEITYIKVPVLRIYGAMDSLVPKKISSILDDKCPDTYSVIIEKAAHTPFISHQKEFCTILLNFKKLLLKY